MAKVKLGARPTSFKRDLSFKMIDGTTGTMQVIYKYRTRKEFAAFADEMQATLQAATTADIEAVKKAAEDGNQLPEFKQSDIVDRQDELNVDYIMGSVEGWNLDVPFNREAVQELVDELPAAVKEMIGSYRDAILEGRAGN